VAACTRVSSVRSADRIDRMKPRATPSRHRAARVAAVCAWLAVASIAVASRAETTAAGASSVASPASASASLASASAPPASASAPPAPTSTPVASPSSAASASASASTPPSLRRAPLSPDEARRAAKDARQMSTFFAHDVTRRLRVPAVAQRAYAVRLRQALASDDLGDLAGEYVVLVDRAANVQALFVYFRATRADAWTMIGASPVSTGLPGTYDHFLTPLGVFEHTPANMDFRAEGTMNDNGIRGYGQRDMRIFDLGWVDGERGWGKGGTSQMRFQMHATDPDRLEPLLGIRHSKGCVRIPASLNVFLDHHGILDAEYEARVEAGKSLWVLHPDRDVSPWAGRYIVVVDSARGRRPAWSPLPGHAAWSKVPKNGDTAD
jgi:hypothetical protein